MISFLKLRCKRPNVKPQTLGILISYKVGVKHLYLNFEICDFNLFLCKFVELFSNKCS